ncbi:MAG: sugar transferase [Acidobacteriota bacterium]
MKIQIHTPPPPPAAALDPTPGNPPINTEEQLRAAAEFLDLQSQANRLLRRVHAKQLAWRVTLASAYGLKRAMDLIVGLLLLGAGAPFLALVALIVKLDSPGPILVGQRRVGKKGVTFTMWKFRSMHINAEQLLDGLQDDNEAGGVIFKMKRDPRITRVGRWLRKLSIDELPQLWNVVRGEMSLVGPRPAIQKEVDQYSSTDRRRLDIKPGLTCFWQVGGRSDVPFKEQVQLDIAYVESQSLALDLKLLLQTIPAVILGRGAY